MSIKVKIKPSKFITTATIEKNTYAEIRKLVARRDHENLYRKFKLWITEGSDAFGSGVQNYPNGMYRPKQGASKLVSKLHTPIKKSRFEFQSLKLPEPKKKL
jgi:hypothetical protein